MATVLDITPDAAVNSIRAAAPLYMKSYSDLTVRNHLLLSLMKGFGNIEYNASDIARIWQVLVREPEVRTFSNTTNKAFADHDAFEQLQVGVRGYEATDLLKELEFKRNQGAQQLINLYDFKMKHLGQTLTKRMQEWLYRDGDDATYLDGYQGFESCLHPYNNTAGGTDAVAGDKIILPKDTYGGQSTQLGAFGGTWSADRASADRYSAAISNDWPYGQGSSDYDPLSPVLWCWDSSAWGSTDWDDNVEKVVRDSVTVLRNKNGMGTGPIDVCILLAANLYPDAENYYSSRFRINQPFTGGDQGFPMPHSLVVDGVALKSDYGCPADVGYVICPEHIEMFNYNTMMSSGPEQMIDSFGPDWSPEHGSFLMRVSTFGNLRIQPKFISKLATAAHYNAM